MVWFGVAAAISVFIIGLLISDWRAGNLRSDDVIDTVRSIAIMFAVALALNGAVAFCWLGRESKSTEISGEPTLSTVNGDSTISFTTVDGRNWAFATNEVHFEVGRVFKIVEKTYSDPDKIWSVFPSYKGHLSPYIYLRP